MRSRIGAVLFGIGVFAVVLAAGAAFYVAPAVAKLPYDLELCKPDQTKDCLRPSVAEARNASFLFTQGGDEPVIKIEQGTLQATTAPQPQADLTDQEMTGELEGEAVAWRVFGIVKWAERDIMISSYQAELALDRVSAEARPWDKQYLQDAGREGNSKVEFAGQLYKFPFDTQPKDYEYFDRDIRRALPMKYQGEDTIQGLDVYRFQQVVPESELNIAPERLTGLLGALGGGAPSGRVTYTNTRTIWVEPVSGTMIKVQEQQKKTLVPSTGQPVTLLDGNFVYTDQTIANNVNSSTETKDGILLISRTLPIALAVLGALLLIAGLVLVTTARRAAARHRSEDLTPADTKVG